MSNTSQKLRSKFNQDYTASTLRVLIILWAILVILLAFYIDNKWILAGILAWEVLP